MKYSPEEKEYALDLLLNSNDYTISYIANRTKISKSTLYRWKRACQIKEQSVREEVSFVLTRNLFNSESHKIAFIKRMRYASFVGDNLNYLYVETPKTACSSIKWLLTKLEKHDVKPNQYGMESSPFMNIHYRKIHGFKSLLELDNEELSKVLKSKSVRRFCVVRNPYARLASTWANKIRQKEPKYLDICESILKYHNKRTDDTPSFKEFVAWLYDNKDKLLFKNPHWQPMHQLLAPEVISYTHVIRFESLVADISLVFDGIFPQKKIIKILSQYHINRSLPYDWKSLYDEKAAKLVSELYIKDFCTYGYSLSSWNVNGKESSVVDRKGYLKELELIALNAIQDRNLVIEQLLKKLKGNS